LIESELFGHEKGAFTGATASKRGKFDLADGGTLFLDEIADMSLKTQAKILRILQEQKFERVGGCKTISVNVRVLAATNKNLEEEIKKGTFREDLYWRLNGLGLHVPPLRERSADIPLLVDFFLDRISAGSGKRGRFTSETMALLIAYPWPGNVRELRSVVERAATLSDAHSYGPEALPDRVRKGGMIRATIAEAAVRHLSLREVERAYLLEILRMTGGNKSRAAEILGLDRKTLYRKLQEYAAESDTL